MDTRGTAWFVAFGSRKGLLCYADIDDDDGQRRRFNEACSIAGAVLFRAMDLWLRIGEALMDLVGFVVDFEEI